MHHKLYTSMKRGMITSMQEAHFRTNDNLSLDEERHVLFFHDVGFYFSVI